MRPREICMNCNGSILQMRWRVYCTVCDSNCCLKCAWGVARCACGSMFPRINPKDEHRGRVKEE